MALKKTGSLKTNIQKSVLDLAFLVAMLGCIYGVCYAAYTYFVGTIFVDVRSLNAKGFTHKEALLLLDYYASAPRKFLPLAGILLIINILAGWLKKRIDRKEGLK
ncbi:hypothetical protein RA27_22715 [Ruegeria sp. ANG-R]|uniref:hypothetical protein n=1 Tax=Ruegeria sp. ANG-R TaxID=1577903 RepID=UPI00057F7A30|nr:hypothetical protein [Ruegeria sp. ANG-R]KIC35652.1 hypothetical protein RA27_22715 [Ruegeria sp. ANG-R]